jgi:dTDP-4-dehydrorhamnose 3,5-epimerase
MNIAIESRHLGEVVVLSSKGFMDERGFSREVFRADQFKEIGLPYEFVQENHSGSVRGVLRGCIFSGSCRWES